MELKLDFGSGPNPAEGFEGVDVLPFDGKVKHVLDVREDWPWAEGSVDEARSSHFVEHLTGAERVEFFNKLFRVLKPGGKFQLIVPHWSNDCAYGDPTHQWPPMTEWSLYYLNKAWRDQNAPHVGYTCDFDWTYGYSLVEDATMRNAEWQQFAVGRYRNVCRDLIATLTKRG